MNRQFSLKTFLAAVFFEGILALIWLFIIPGDSTNIWIFGFSKFRFLLFVGLLVLLVLAGFLAFRARKNPAWHGKISRNIQAFYQSSSNLTTTLVLSLFGLGAGLHFLNTAFTTTDVFVQGYFTRLAPFMFWFTAISGQILVFTILDFPTLKTYLRAHGLALALLIVILLVGMSVHSYLWELDPEQWDTHDMFNKDEKFDLLEQDIYAIFNEGNTLQRGINPYARTLEERVRSSDYKWNLIFATYLPLPYLFAWLTRSLGIDDYLQWLRMWRVFCLIANLGITYILFYIPYHRYKNIMLAVIASVFWLFNRWTLHMTMIYHTDFIAIFFMLISLIHWPKRKILSLLAFGLSLSVKHIAIFMIPLYLVWIWQSVKDKDRSLWRFIKLSLVMGSVPLILSAPFIAWNPLAFYKSIFVSATRISESHFGAPGLDTLLFLEGIPAKLPLLAMLAIIYLAAWHKKVKMYSAAFLVLLTFIDFNSVLFRQYMTWVFPTIPLMLCETWDKQET